MINTIKEFADIAFQYPTWPRVIPTDLSDHLIQPVEGFMCAFADPTGIAVKDESFIKYRIKYPMDSMVQ